MPTKPSAVRNRLNISWRLSQLYQPGFEEWYDVELAHEVFANPGTKKERLLWQTEYNTHFIFFTIFSQSCSTTFLSEKSVKQDKQTKIPAWLFLYISLVTRSLSWFCGCVHLPYPLDSGSYLCDSSYRHCSDGLYNPYKTELISANEHCSYSKCIHIWIHF